MTRLATWIAIISLLFIIPPFLSADEKTLGGEEPVLQLQSQGPTATTTSLALSEDGNTLFAGGFDKIVRVWNWADNQFVLQEQRFRVPLGPGTQGLINCLAASPDNQWLAVAGISVVRGLVTFGSPGKIKSRSNRTPEQWLDEGQIYLFNRYNEKEMRILRGHRGPVLAMACSPKRSKSPAVLVTLAREWDGKKYISQIRCWNLKTFQEINPPTPFPTLTDRKGAPVELDIQTFGDESKVENLLIGIAYGDLKFRVWNLATGKTSEGNEDLLGAVVSSVKVNNNKQFITGSFARKTQRAHFRLWQQNRFGELNDTSIPTDWNALPTKIVTPRKNSNRIFCVVWLPRNPREKRFSHEYLLQSIDVAEKEILLKQNIKLLSFNQPGLKFDMVMDPQGRFLAFADNEKQEIQIRLLNKLSEQHQRLQSQGLRRRRIAFVENGNQAGLLFNDQEVSRPNRDSSPTAPVKGDVICNFATGDFTSDNLQDWEVVKPTGSSGWKLTQDKDNTRKWILSQNGRERTHFVLQPSQSITTWAVLPQNPPLIAIAYKELGGVRITLLAASKNRNEPAQVVRWYTSHVNDIHGLAFSKDGRLLASASDDETVCLWRLAGLDRLIGQQGTLLGMSLQEANGKLQSTTLDTRRLSAENAKVWEKANIRAGTPFQGIVLANDKVLAFNNSELFHEYLWQTQPGTKVTLRFGRRTDVEMTVDQGIDDQRPLLTIFRTAKGWIAWNPLGPYDFSNDQMEKAIIWHRNPQRPDEGKAGSAPSIGLPEEDRKKLRVEGLIKSSFAEANINKILKEFQAKLKKNPTLTVKLLENGVPLSNTIRTDRRGISIIQNTKATLRVTVDNTEVDRLRWQFNNGILQRFIEGGNVNYSADLQRLQWKRNYHRLSVRLRTFESEPRTLIGQKEVLYLPPPPKILFAKQWLQPLRLGRLDQNYQSVSERTSLSFLIRKEAKFRIQARVDPGIAGQAVDIVLERDGKVIRKFVHPIIDFVAPLEKGKNEFVLKVTNRIDPASGIPLYPAYEQTVRRFSVQYSPVATPNIRVISITPTSMNEPPLKGSTLLVPSAKVTIRGRIEAETKLTEAKLIGPVNVDLLKKFTVNKMNELTFELPIQPLKLGMQELTIRAVSEDSELATYSINLDYQPPLPVFKLLRPQKLDFLPAKTTKITLVGLLDSWLKHDYQFQVYQGDKLVPSKADRETNELSAELALKPGRNPLRVVISLGERTRKYPLSVYVQQSPIIDKVNIPRKAAMLSVPIYAEVLSPSNLPLTRVRVQSEHVPGERLIDFDGFISKMGAPVNGMQRWRIQFPFSLKPEKDYSVKLYAENKDGESSHSTMILGPKKKVENPVIRFSYPTENGNTSEDHINIRFTVKSKTPVVRVVVQRNGEELSTAPKQTGKDSYELRVPLAKLKANRITVLAENKEGGKSSDERAITYIPRTVQIEYARLWIGEEKRTSITPAAMEPIPSFDKAEDGIVWIEGNVTWPIDREDLWKSQFKVIVEVNGYSQPEALLEAEVKNLQRRFRIKLRLNRLRDNVVKLRFPGLIVDPATPTEFRIAACAKPIRMDQRLHVLAIGIGRRNSRGLIPSILETFQAKEPEKNIPLPKVHKQFKTERFPKGGRIYGPVQPDANRDDIYDDLADVNALVMNESRDGAAKDVVVLYFQGDAYYSPEDDEYYLLTIHSDKNNPKDFPATALTLKELRNRVRSSFGAQLLLIDVHHQKGKGKLNAEKFTKDLRGKQNRVGEMHYAWLSKTAPEKGKRLLDDLKQSLPEGYDLREIGKVVTRVAQAKPTLSSWVEFPDTVATTPFGFQRKD